MVIVRLLDPVSAPAVSYYRLVHELFEGIDGVRCRRHFLSIVTSVIRPMIGHSMYKCSQSVDVPVTTVQSSTTRSVLAPHFVYRTLAAHLEETILEQLEVKPEVLVDY